MLVLNGGRDTLGSCFSDPGKRWCDLDWDVEVEREVPEVKTTDLWKGRGSRVKVGINDAWLLAWAPVLGDGDTD